MIIGNTRTFEYPIGNIKLSRVFIGPICICVFRYIYIIIMVNMLSSLRTGNGTNNDIAIADNLPMAHCPPPPPNIHRTHVQNRLILQGPTWELLIDPGSRPVFAGSCGLGIHLLTET